ncbi:MAG: MOSC domain-containing protein [Cryobacterium sp.]|uniref:MOSC domain-containing protein n=1 Tax=unclassified Cryobacterium TaxID=2649013 RepID=UPI0018C8EECE|nr:MULTISPECIES: MOSC domain-containing protein [unclassified Cryobacterium]MCY7403272.1 MOSC domain-containing protein [Cryobacterium sp.]MEC5153670.1 MOSC domain-containing protein YiiM [Cryobacterium sp. CAN_C3]
MTLERLSGTVVSGTVVSGTVVSVSRDDEHRFSKPAVASIRLLAGIGVEGDSHAGATVQHLYEKKRNPSAPNLCQVHFMAVELFDALVATGYTVAPGELGENVTTAGIDLMSLPLWARLHLGNEAVVAITGMRSPCSLINGYQKGLMKQLITTDATGTVARRGGIMGVVVTGGVVNPGDGIRVELPAGEQQPLGVV